MTLVAHMDNIDLDNIPVHIQDQDTRKAWDALLHLFRRPWWTRSWVLQEVGVASSDPLVGCGHKWLAWSKFKLAIDLMTRSVSTRVLQTPPPTFNAIQGVRDYRKNMRPSMRVGHLLQTTLAFEATDPRDKVFALLGLVHEDDRSALKPDYSKPIQQVYTELAHHLIGIDINILCFNVNSPSHSLPSWVPDWSRSSQRWPLWMAMTYSASGRSQANSQSAKDPGILEVAGILVDHISHFDAASRIKVSQSPTLDSSEEEVLDNIESTLRGAIKEQPSSNLSSLDFCKSDALWKTLVTNRSLFGSAHIAGPKTPVPIEYGKMFEVFRNRSRIPTRFKPELPHPQRKQEYVKPFVSSMELGDQRFFITLGGHIGLGPHQLRRDDMVVLIFGADMPFVLRSRGTHHQLIGPSYVHGIMDGEGLKSKTKAELKQSMISFTLK